MGTKFIQDSTLTNIASAIRAKTGGTDAFTPAQMVTAIQNIPTGGDTDNEDAFVTRTISEYTNPRVSVIGNYAFYSCSTLTTVSFPVCTTIGSYAFYNCSKLTTASFPVCTTIGNAVFMGCYILTTASFPVCTTINGSAFYNCSKLTTVSFPVCTTINGNAFQYCSKLTTASFPVCTSIRASAFYSCKNLTSLFILASSVCQLANSNALSNTPMANSTYLGYFGSIFVPASLVSAYKAATNWTYFADRITAAPEGS